MRGSPEGAEGYSEEGVRVPEEGEGPLMEVRTLPEGCGIPWEGDSP